MEEQNDTIVVSVNVVWNTIWAGPIKNGAAVLVQDLVEPFQRQPIGCDPLRGCACQRPQCNAPRCRSGKKVPNPFTFSLHLFPPVIGSSREQDDPYATGL